MGLLLVDAFIVGAIGLGVRWALARPPRLVPLLVALPASILFILARNRWDLEDSEFLWALLAGSAGAFVATVALCLSTRQRWRRSLVFGAIAAVLVPILFGAYVAAALTTCLVTDCDMS